MPTGMTRPVSICLSPGWFIFPSQPNWAPFIPGRNFRKFPEFAAGGGARLGYGLCDEDNDLDLPAIASLCDAFYIGGTKVGALFGEALVLRHEALKEDFRYIAKQKGGRLAKGRLLGIQFLELFRDGLYFRLGAHADRLAVMLRDFCRSRGLSLPFSSGTNQQFVTMPDSVLEELGRKYGFAYLRREDETHSTVRFCMSWATREEDVRELMADIARLC